MTEADFLLKRLFLAPLDFLSPFRPIASWPHGRHPEILIDCPSGFTFHFSMAFLGFSSIFLGFLFHLAEVYSRSYYCFAETALCGNTNALICMLARCAPEISFPSNRRSWCESDYRPIEDDAFLLQAFQEFRIVCAALDSCQLSPRVVHPLWHLEWICHSITAQVLFLRYKPRLGWNQHRLHDRECAR